MQRWWHLHARTGGVMGGLSLPQISVSKNVCDLVCAFNTARGSGVTFQQYTVRTAVCRPHDRDALLASTIYYGCG
jgi:hypothetical protein